MDPLGKGPHLGTVEPGSLTMPSLDCLLPNSILSVFFLYNSYYLRFGITGGLTVMLSNCSEVFSSLQCR